MSLKQLLRDLRSLNLKKRMHFGNSHYRDGSDSSTYLTPGIKKCLNQLRF